MAASADCQNVRGKINEAVIPAPNDPAGRVPATMDFCGQTRHYDRRRNRNGSRSNRNNHRHWHQAKYRTRDR